MSDDSGSSNDAVNVKSEPSEDNSPAATSAATALAEVQPAYPPLKDEDEIADGSLDSNGEALREKKTGKPLQILHELSENDVLLGRGTGPNDHEGNVRFRDQIIKTQDDYVSSATRKEKTEIAKKTIKYIKSRKGRFVRRLDKHELKLVPEHSGDTVFCVVTDDDLLLEKTKQSFRHQIRKRASGGINKNQLAREIGRANARPGSPSHPMMGGSEPMSLSERRVAAMARLQQDERRMLSPNSAAATASIPPQASFPSQGYPLGYAQQPPDPMRSRLSMEQELQHSMQRQQQLSSSMGYPPHGGPGAGGHAGGNGLLPPRLGGLQGMPPSQGMGPYSHHNPNYMPMPHGRHNQSLGGGHGMNGAYPHHGAGGNIGGFGLGAGGSGNDPRGGAGADMLYGLPPQGGGAGAAPASAAGAPPYRRPGHSIKQTMINDAMALLRAAEQYDDYTPHPHPPGPNAAGQPGPAMY